MAPLHERARASRGGLNRLSWPPDNISIGHMATRHTHPKVPMAKAQSGETHRPLFGKWENIRPPKLNLEENFGVYHPHPGPLSDLT